MTVLKSKDPHTAFYNDQSGRFYLDGDRKYYQEPGTGKWYTVAKDGSTVYEETTGQDGKSGPQLTRLTDAANGGAVAFSPASVEAVYPNTTNNNGGSKIQVGGVVHNVKETVEEVIAAIEDGLQVWGALGHL